MNRARKFITMKMKKRMELRDSKNSKKNKIRARKLLSEQVLAQLRAQFEQQGLMNQEDQVNVNKIETGGDAEEDEGSETPIVSAKSGAADTGNQAADSEKRQMFHLDQQQQIDAGSTGSDEILNISATKQKKKKKTKGQRRRETAEKESTSGVKKRKVIFNTENNVTREFHSHSRVATRALPNDPQLSEPLKSAIKKPREAKQAVKLQKK